MLEAVTCCVTTHTTNPILLVLAVGAGLLGAVGAAAVPREGAGFILAGIVVGAFFFLAYLLTRQRVLRIDTAGGAINFAMGGVLDMSAVRGFIDDLEAAKNDRYLAPGAAAPPLARPLGSSP